MLNAYSSTPVATPDYASKPDDSLARRCCTYCRRPDCDWCVISRIDHCVSRHSRQSITHLTLSDDSYAAAFAASLPVTVLCSGIAGRLVVSFDPNCEDRNICSTRYIWNSVVAYGPRLFFSAKAKILWAPWCRHSAWRSFRFSCFFGTQLHRSHCSVGRSTLRIGDRLSHCCELYVGVVVKGRGRRNWCHATSCGKMGGTKADTQVSTG